MSKHPTLVDVIKHQFADLGLTRKDGAEKIGVSHATLAKFLAGQVVSKTSMEKIRSFTENPNAPTSAQPAKGKKKSKGSEIALDDLRFLQNLKPDDLRFVVNIMEATGQVSLTRDQMINLISLRK